MLKLCIPEERSLALLLHCPLFSSAPQAPAMHRALPHCCTGFCPPKLYKVGLIKIGIFHQNSALTGNFQSVFLYPEYISSK